MNKWLKLFCTALLVVCVVASLVGCQTVEGLQEKGEWNNDPSGISRNKELAHTKIFSYETVADALANDYENSAYYVSLNGTWSFNLLTDVKDIPADFMTASFDASSWSAITVPGNWEVQGFSTPTYTYATYPWNVNVYTPAAVSENRNEIGLYRREIEVPASWDGREVYISLEGVESAAYIYVNGYLVGYAEDTYTTKDFRVTQYLTYGASNTVCVKVYKYSDGSWLEAQDGLKLGGIFRDIYLYSAPKKEIKDIAFTYKFTENYDGAILYATVDLASYDEVAEGEYVTVALYDNADGSCYMEETKLGSKVQYEVEKTGGAYRTSVNNKFSLNNMKLWSAETPNLYTAVVSFYAADGTLLDMTSTRIGFREMDYIVVDGEKVLAINGKEVQLYGVNYNEHSSVNGKAITRDEMIEDIKTMKSLNINAVRSAGVPFSTDFLELCDEYGLYVISELNIETEPWTSQGSLSLPGDQAIWQSAVLDRLNNVMERDKNNASVVMWSLGNQSGTGTNISTVKNWLIANDTRLVVYNAYYTEDDYGNIDFTTVGDIISTTGWDVGKLNEVIDDNDITEPLFVTDLNVGLLNGGGEISYYVNLLESTGKVQGVFLSYYKDRSLYMPIDSKNAVSVVRETPYNEQNSKLYQLQYAASWSTKDLYNNEVIRSLSGLVSGDGTLQSEAYELKNAYSPISIVPVDLANGVFNVTNRNAYTTFNGNYEISYEVIKNGTTVVKSASTKNVGVEPSMGATVYLDYGTLSGNDDYFVTVTVKSLKTPSWADKDYDNVIFEAQYDLSGNTTPVKDGTEADVSGEAFVKTEFVAPVINATLEGLLKGNIYVTNLGGYDFDEMFTLSYKVLEINKYWNEPRLYVYDEGTVDTSSVKSGIKYQQVKNVFDVHASDKSEFRILFTVTVKQDVGSVKAGTEIVYTFDKSNYEVSSLAFPIDESRIPEAVLNEKGKQEKDENGKLLWVGGPFDDETKLFSEKTYEKMKESSGVAPESFLVLKNGKVEIGFDVKTGLLVSYKVDGKQMLASGEDVVASMLLSLMRSLTGGDLLCDVSSSDNLSAIMYASSVAGKQLTTAALLEQISDTHYRMNLSYRVVSKDVSKVLVANETSEYNVVYDVYADGTVNVSIALDLANAAGVPTEIANLITLSSDYSNVTWYGRGMGETYADKLYNSKIAKWQASADALTVTGDRSATRWVAFTDKSGNGVMFTSDDNLFAFNVDKAYPWEGVKYASDVASRKFNVVSIIGAQRGVSAGSAQDEQYLGNSTAIEAGSVVSYSFRMVPVVSGTNYAAEAASVISTNGQAKVERKTISSAKTYALATKSALKQYLTVANGEVSLNAATGATSQIYKRVFTNITTSVGEKTYAYQNLKNALWLTPSETDTKGESFIEIGFAERDTSLKWQSWMQNGTELNSVSSSYVLGIYDKALQNGARLTAMKTIKEDYTAFSIVVDATNQNNVMIKSTLDGLFISAADSVTYSDPMIEEKDLNRINYALATDFGSSLEGLTVDHSKWVQLLERATLFEALPGTMQEWKFKAVGANEYTITNVSNGTLIGVEKTENHTLGTSTLSIVSVDSGADLSEIATVWVLEDLGGYYRITNKEFGVVLQSEVERSFMSKTDRAYQNIVNIDDAVQLTTVLTLGTWNDTACQKWELSDNEDREINIEIGSAWLDYVARKESSGSGSSSSQGSTGGASFVQPTVVK